MSYTVIIVRGSFLISFVYHVNVNKDESLKLSVLVKVVQIIDCAEVGS